MEELTNEVNQAPVRRPRRKRSKFQIFKEAYLPLVIVAVAALLVVTFVVGSIGRLVDKNKAEKEASIAASESIAIQEAAWQAEASHLLATAEEMAEWAYFLTVTNKFCTGQNILVDGGESINFNFVWKD